jgi:hypothetical protein
MGRHSTQATAGRKGVREANPRRLRKSFKVAALVSVGVLAVGTAANALPADLRIPTLTGHHAQPAVQQLQPAGKHPMAVEPNSLVDSTVESKYTPIAPCLIADTRVAGGAIAANSARNFHALGNGSFAGQGGSSCDIPYSATAVTGSVTSFNATGTGDLKVYAYGGAHPTAAFLNYVTTPVLSASGTIPVADSTYDFTVKAYSASTQVVIQLTGYFIRPMWAEVGSGATFIQGSRTTAVSALGTGLYDVDFDRDISGCAYSANSYSAGVSVEVEPRVTNVDGVFVTLEGSTGALVSADFYLTVTC